MSETIHSNPENPIKAYEAEHPDAERDVERARAMAKAANMDATFAAEIRADSKSGASQAFADAFDILANESAKEAGEKYDRDQQFKKAA